MKAIYEPIKKSYIGDAYEGTEVTIWDQENLFIDAFDAPTDIDTIDELKDFVAEYYKFDIESFDAITEWEIL